MTSTLDDYRATIDPPDELTEEPTGPALPNDTTCAHCPEPATLRFDGHNPDTLRTPGRVDPCPINKPFRLCTRCYLAWHNWNLRSWYKNGFAICGVCKAEGDTIEALFPFKKI